MEKDRGSNNYYFTIGPLIKIIEYSPDARTTYTSVSTCPIITPLLHRLTLHDDNDEE